MNTDKITQDEMIKMFGESMPTEAVNLMWNSPGTKTVGEVRAELRRIAEGRDSDALKIRLRYRTNSSPKAGTRQAWSEYQVVSRGKVIDRFDLLSQARAKYPSAKVHEKSR